MNAVLLVIIGWLAFFLGYRFYSKFIAKRIYRLSADTTTPAHAYEDGVDYVPTNPFVLWGHHFTSVAGAAPIVGPAIAVIWGWLPAFLWVILGTLFIGGVHDYRYLSTLIAVGSCLLLAFGAGGSAGTGGLTIWPLFGTTNQLLAALTLLVVSVMLVKLARPYWYTVIPLVFVLGMTIVALLLQLGDFWTQQNYFLLFLDILILIAAVWVVLESAFVFNRAKQDAAEKSLSES